MDPMSMGIGAGLNLVGSIPGLVNAIQQGKERRKLLAEGPEGLTPLEYQQMATAQNRANMSQVAGYGQELENINQQQANALGEAKRAGVSSSNMLNALTRLNQQGQAARRNLAIRGAQGQRAAQSELGGLQGVASANLQNRKRYWEKNLADLDTARKQQIAQFATSPFQGAMAGMRYGGGAATPTSGTPAPESGMYNPYSSYKGIQMSNPPPAQSYVIPNTPPMLEYGDQIGGYVPRGFGFYPNK